MIRIKDLRNYAAKYMTIITAYHLNIDEMLNNSLGSYYVSGWDEDLKRLKHYRWVRNQIVHDPVCTEENMCEFGDAEWLEQFRSRIMSSTDPLTLYRKAKNSQPKPKSNDTYTTEPRTYTYPQHTSVPERSTGCLTIVIGVLTVVVAVTLLIISII